MYKNKKILAVIPARGGSKGIHKKNLQRINGKSLIAIAAKSIHDFGLTDAKIISTDDRTMAEEAVSHGIDAPFLRPESLAADKSESIDMWKHAWQEAEKFYNMEFDISVLLEPTCPLRKSEDIKAAIECLISSQADSVVTVSKTPAHYTPHKTLTVDGETKKLGFYHEKGSNYSIRQSIPDYFHRNGACYACSRKAIFESNSIITNNTRAVVIERELVNIDTSFDLELARWLSSR